MRTLSTITMAILCGMLVAACQQDAPDPRIENVDKDIKELTEVIEAVDKNIKELIKAFEEAFEEASFEDLNKERREAFVGDLNEEIIRKKLRDLQEDWTGRVKKISLKTVKKKIEMDSDIIYMNFLIDIHFLTYKASSENCTTPVRTIKKP